MAGNQRSSGPSGASGREPAHDGLATAPVLLLSGARLADGRPVDVRLSGGRIEAVGRARLKGRAGLGRISLTISRMISPSPEFQS